jgi:hypothetical protein
MKEKFVFQGLIYSRDTESKYLSYKRYFRRKRYDRRSGKYVWDLLHRVIWEAYNGKIPWDCIIHHKDGDWNNNDISNLECILARDHLHNCHHYRSQPKERLFPQETVSLR